MSRLARRFRTPALGVLCAGLATVAIVSGYRVWEHARLDSARQDAVAAAERMVPEMLSYDIHTLDADIARAKANATGPFRDEFARLVDTVVAPAAKQQGIVAWATVSAAGVVDSRHDEVIVLMFLTQSTQSTPPAAQGGPPATPSPLQVQVSRVRVTMEPDENGWAVAGMSPV